MTLEEILTGVLDDVSTVRVYLHDGPHGDRLLNARAALTRALRGLSCQRDEVAHLKKQVAELDGLHTATMGQRDEARRERRVATEGRNAAEAELADIRKAMPGFNVVMDETGELKAKLESTHRDLSDSRRAFNGRHPAAGETMADRVTRMVRQLSTLEEIRGALGCSFGGEVGALTGVMDTRNEAMAKVRQLEELNGKLEGVISGMEGDRELAAQSSARLTPLIEERDEARADVTRLESERAQFTVASTQLAGALEERDEVVAMLSDIRKAFDGRIPSPGVTTAQRVSRTVSMLEEVRGVIGCSLVGVVQELKAIVGERDSALLRANERSRKLKSARDELADIRNELKGELPPSLGTTLAQRVGWVVAGRDSLRNRAQTPQAHALMVLEIEAALSELGPLPTGAKVVATVKSLVATHKKHEAELAGMVRDNGTLRNGRTRALAELGVARRGLKSLQVQYNAELERAVRSVRDRVDIVREDLSRALAGRDKAHAELTAVSELARGRHPIAAPGMAVFREVELVLKAEGEWVAGVKKLEVQYEAACSERDAARYTLDAIRKSLNDVVWIRKDSTPDEVVAMLVKDRHDHPKEIAGLETELKEAREKLSNALVAAGLVRRGIIDGDADRVGLTMLELVRGVQRDRADLKSLQVQDRRQAAGGSEKDLLRHAEVVAEFAAEALKDGEAEFKQPDFDFCLGESYATVVHVIALQKQRNLARAQLEAVRRVVNGAKIGPDDPPTCVAEAVKQIVEVRDEARVAADTSWAELKEARAQLEAVRKAAGS